MPRLILFIFVLTSSAWAREHHSSECEDRLASLMNHTFCTPSLYWHGRCGDNVANLVAEARRWGLNLEDAEVVILHHEKRMVPPVPVAMDYPLEPAPHPARNRPAQWKFHVVLSVVRDGRHLILDLDYADHAVEAERYFNGMFPKRNVGREFQSADRVSSIFMRRVPLHEYLDAHARLGGDEVAVHYRQGKDLISVRTFLNEVRR